MLSATQILKISKNRPDLLFTSQSSAKSEIQKLRHLWHPDRNNNALADQVYAHINHIYRNVSDGTSSDEWSNNSTLLFKVQNRKYNFKYLKVHQMDTGKVYIGHTNVLHVFNSENEDLFTKATRMLSTLKFPSKKFETEFGRFFPINSRTFNSDIGQILLIPKTKDVISLHDLLEFLPHKLHPKHVCWIISSCMNLLAFLEHTGKTHNAITTESIYITPKYHAVSILGGWEYATNIGDTIVAIPKKLHAVMPKIMFVDKISNPRYDVLGVKAMALECLGDPSFLGSRLLLDNTIPNELIHWARLPCSGTTKQEYRNWQDVLTAAYGKERKFFKFTTNIDNIYGE